MYEVTVKYVLPSVHSIASALDKATLIAQSAAQAISTDVQVKDVALKSVKTGRR